MSKLFNPQRISGGAVFGPQDSAAPAYVRSLGFVRALLERMGASGVVGTAPSFSVAPSIIGTPTVGVASAYTPGTVSGSPTITQQWTLDGADIVGETSATYTPIPGDATHLLRVREIATNGYGSANSTSASATVSAAAGSPGALSTTFTLTSPNTATAPFTIGHAFKQGDVSSAQDVAVTGATAQVTKLNAWPDGSLKFAIIAGTASLTAATPATVSLAVGTASSGTALTTANLKTAMSGQTCSIARTGVKDWSFSPASHTIGALIRGGTFVSATVSVDNGATAGAVTHTDNLDGNWVLTAPVSGGTENGFQTVIFTLNYLDGGGAPNTNTLTVVGYVRTGGGIEWDATAKKMVYASDCSYGDSTVSWATTDWDSPFSWEVGKTAFVSGQEMSSWLYRKPFGSDPHMVAWLEVRLFKSGAVEILPWIENGYLFVTRPTSKIASYVFTLGSTVRSTQTIDLPGRCRTPLVAGTALSYWLGTDPAVTPLHNIAYMQSTDIVPSYRAVTPSSATQVTAQVTSFVPLQQGNWTYPSDAMGGTGYSPPIGMLPEHDVLYMTCQTSTIPYFSIQANAYGAGRYDTHMRDEATNLPIAFSSWPNISINSSSTSQYPLGATGTAAKGWDVGHQPSVGFFPYLVTGRYYFMEEMQFASCIDYMGQVDVLRGYSNGVYLSQSGAATERGAAWSVRMLAQAASLTPDGHPLQAEFIASLAANIDYNHARYVAQSSHPQGFVQAYADYTGADGVFFGSSWMQDFYTAAYGYAKALNIAIPSASKTRLTAFFAWKAQSIVGRLGSTGSTEFLYRDAAPYAIALAPTDTPDYDTGTGPWYSDWGAIYNETFSGASGGPPFPSPGSRTDGDLRGSSGSAPTGASGYWGNLQPAIAYAIQHGVSGAQAGFDRMAATPAWAVITAAMNTDPVWSVCAKGTGSAIPSWVPPSGMFADVPMLNNPYDVPPSLYLGSDMDDPFTLWGGSAVLPLYSPLGAQVYHSAGHETSGGSPNLQFTLICDFSTLRWSSANEPAALNASSTFDATTGRAPDGTPYNPHTYLGLQGFPAAWGGSDKTLAQFFYAGSSFENSINLMDVSSTVGGYSLLTTNQAANSAPTKISFSASGVRAGTYPITVQDDVRQGWWAATNGTVDYNLFISKTGDITQYTSLGGNGQDSSLVLCPSLDLLIAIDGGYDAGTYANNRYRTLNIRNLTTNVLTDSLTLGPVPSLGQGYDGPDLNYHSPGKLGLQWVEELGAIYGLDDSVAPAVVVKLTPPASSPATNQWTWSTVAVTHWSGDPSGQSALQISQNSVWSKFRWIPSLHAFVYGTAKDRKPQVIRI